MAQIDSSGSSLQGPAVRLTAEQDAALIELGYEPIAVRGKAPVAPNWQNERVTSARIAAQRAQYPDAVSTGLRTGRLVGVDIDLQDAEHATGAETLAAEMLGPTVLRRIGRKGVMLCYRNETPIPKIWIAYPDPNQRDARGNPKWITLLEVLGTGRQFVAYGIHPDTLRPYEWRDVWLYGHPLEYPLARLPEVTPEKIQAFMVEARDLLENLGYVGARIKGVKRERVAEATSKASGVPVPEDYLRRMVALLDPDTERDDWVQVVGAIRATPVIDDPSEEARRQITLAWSRGELGGWGTPSRYKSDDAVNETFDSMPPKEDGVGFGSLWKWARGLGWTERPPQAAAGDVFKQGIEREQEQRKAEGASPSTEKWKLCDVDEIDTWPDPVMLVETLLVVNTHAGIGGPSKAGKTLVALDIALCVATGVPVFGRFAVRRPGHVFYFSGEGKQVFKPRIRAWLQEHPNADRAELKKHFHLIAEVPMTSDGADLCRDYAAEARAKIGDASVALTIVDTMSRSLDTLDENESAAANLFYKIMEAVREALGDCTTLTLIHSTKAPKNFADYFRGNGAIIANLDTPITLDRKEGQTIATLDCPLPRDTQPFGPFTLRFKPVILEGVSDPELARQGVLVYDPAANPAIKEAAAAFADRSGRCAHIREVLEKHGATEQGKAVTKHVFLTYLANWGLTQQEGQSREDMDAEVDRRRAIAKTDLDNGMRPRKTSPAIYRGYFEERLNPHSGTKVVYWWAPPLTEANERG